MKQVLWEQRTENREQRTEKLDFLKETGIEGNEIYGKN